MDALVVALAVVDPAMAFGAAMLAVAGSTAGCMVLYSIARKGGRLYLDKHTAGGRGRRFRLWFVRYGLITVFIPALLPLPLPTKVFVISAGALGIRPVPFLLVVLAARIPRYLGLAYLGVQLGEHSMVWLKEHAWQLGAFAIGLFVFLYLLARLSGRVRKPLPGLG